MDSKQSSLISPNIFALKLFGYWPTGSRTYQIYTDISICSITIFLAGQFAYMFVNFNDLQEVLSTFYILSCFAIILIKAAAVLRNHHKVLKLIERIDSEIFAPLNGKQTAIIEENKRLYTKLQSICTYLSIITAIFWTIRPVMVKEKNLPMKTWFFTFNVLERPLYEILYVFQATVYTTYAIIIFNIDTMTAGFMMVLGSQIDILCDKLKHLDTFRFDSDFEGFKHCCQHYNAILDVSKQIQEIYAVPIFAQFAGAVMILCTTMIQITIIPLVSVEFLALAIYTSCILTDLCLYCWFGTAISYKSNQIVHAIFHAPWLAYDTSLKKDLIFFMLVAKKPIILRTAGIVPIGIGLQAFMTVVRSSYSYFTVLSQFDA